MLLFTLTSIIPVYFHSILAHRETQILTLENKAALMITFMEI